MAFGGFLIRFDEMPSWWQWYAYLDYLRYGWGAFLINQFSNHPDAQINGLPVLQYYGVDNYSKWAMLGYEALFFCGFFGAAWAALQFKTLAKR
jgi:ATP-binding cassette, subfamily G (WHITE), member 2